MCLYTFWSSLKLKLEVKRANVLQHNLFLWGFQLPSAILGALRKREAWQYLPPLYRNPWGRLSCMRDSPFCCGDPARLAKGYVRPSGRCLWSSTTTCWWPPRVGPAVCRGSWPRTVLRPTGARGSLEWTRVVSSLPGMVCTVTQFVSAVTEITESIRVSPLPWVASADRQPCCGSAVRKRHSNGVESLQKC